MDWIKQICGAYHAKMINCDRETVLLECVCGEERNNELAQLLEDAFPGRLEIVRGGSVAIEAAES